MQFKKSALAVALFSILLGSPVYAETDGWGAVAGGADSDAWGEQTPASAGSGWGDSTETEAVAPAQPKAEPGKPACGKDDPRYASLVPVLRELQAGKSIEPMQTSFTTYVTLNSNVRKILGDNIYISSADCSEQYLFDGALTGKINVPFTDLWQVINDTLRTDDQGLLGFVAKNTRAAPESALSVISMVQYVHLDDNQSRKLYLAIAPEKAKPTQIEKPLMLEVFLAFGGAVNEADRGKTVFLGTYGDSIHAIYLERQGGLAKPQDVKERGSSARVSSLLQSAGLVARVEGNEVAARLASE